MIWLHDILFWMQLNLPHPSVIIAACVLAWIAVAFWDQTEWEDEDRWR